MKRPDISIIIPVYNVRNYIAQCLESVKAQAFRDGECEIIVVDDGSTDGSADVISDYILSGYVRYFRKENGGLSSARNAGMAVATGEFFYFLDPDDILMPGCLSKGLRAAKEKGVDMLWFSVTRVTDDSVSGLGYEEILKKALKDSPTRSGEMGPVIDSREFITETRPLNYVWQYIVRRAALEGMSFMEGHFIEDCLFTYELLLKGVSTATMDTILYCYRVRPQSITTARDTAKRIRLAEDYIFASEQLKALLTKYNASGEAYDFIWNKAQAYLVREGLMQLLKNKDGQDPLKEHFGKLKDAGLLPLTRPSKAYFPHYKYGIYTFILNSKLLKGLFGLISHAL